MSQNDDLNAIQCRTGRAVLNWTQSELAKESGVSLRAIQDLESEKRNPTYATRMALRYSMEKSNVEFMDSGARLVAASQLRGLCTDPKKAGYRDEIES